MLKKFKHNFLACDMSKYFISEYIGYSKLLFLDADDKYTIINEELGKWADGNWYSNDSYKQYNDYSYYGNVKVSKTTAMTPTISSYKVDAWDDAWDKKWDYTPAVIDDEPLDEWSMYEEICDIYGLEVNDELTWDSIQGYMDMNLVNSIEDMYNLLINYK
jgi:hypothetical protein